LIIEANTPNERVLLARFDFQKLWIWRAIRNNLKPRGKLKILTFDLAILKSPMSF
jgi:hypothetical protein